MALHHLAVGQQDATHSLLQVVHEAPLESHPTLLDPIEVAVVKTSTKCRWMLVEKRASSIELVVQPVPSIGRSTNSVKKSASSMDTVIFKVSFVVNSIRVSQLSVPIFEVVQHHALVATSIFILTSHKHTFFL